MIDGFTFLYGTNNVDPVGEDIAVYFYDSCTGWGNLGVMEAGFAFTDLPNHYSYSPYTATIWAITVDLEGTGYEFLLNRDFGMAMCFLKTPTMGFTGPAIGCPPNRGGNGPTGTEDVFDTYYPNRTFENSWWFGSGYPTNPWATFSAELFGTEGEGINHTVYGVGAQGNGAGLYATKHYLPGSCQSLHFLLRRNGLEPPGYLIASLCERNQYLGSAWDVTRLVGTILPTFPRKMNEISTYPGFGDFSVIDVSIPSWYPGCTVYFQAVLDELPFNQAPLEGSNGIRVN